MEIQFSDNNNGGQMVTSGLIKGQTQVSYRKKQPLMKTVCDRAKNRCVTRSITACDWTG